MAERAVQAAVGLAKETVIVKSLKVIYNNFLSNQYQLVAHGLNPFTMAKGQLGKMRELETHLRLEKRLTKLTLELAYTSDIAKRRTLQREERSLRDAASRLSIAPLIEAGELPSIAEDVSEHDEYTYAGDMAKWLEKKAKNVPSGLITAAKYAIVAKDTALYQGLNRGIQFGDFVAKAVLFDHLIAKGRTREEALAYVNDRFVNYNLLPGRTRTALEGMGLTWFWNYKLRIQKVILATIRDNPLRFLMAGSIGEMVGVSTLMGDNVLSQNWGYSMGYSQLIRARKMLLWNQLMP